MEYLENRFSQGIRDSVPIGLGYHVINQFDKCRTVFGIDPYH